MKSYLVLESENGQVKLTTSLDFETNVSELSVNNEMIATDSNLLDSFYSFYSTLMEEQSKYNDTEIELRDENIELISDSFTSVFAEHAPEIYELISHAYELLNKLNDE